MAIRYVDLVNGNDANNGTTFALRKKTITSAASGLTGGDTIRVMKSDDPTSLGSCTWSNSTTTVILPGAVTAEVSKSQNADWTVVTNVTKTNWTSTDALRIGTNGIQLNIAAAFTTGKVAYAPCTTADLSGYQQISFILGNSVTIAANNIYLDLCSDTTGDVPVVSLALPAVTNSPSYGYPVTLDYGANLPSGINSIALRCVADPGSQVIRLNHIIACKAKTDNSSLTLNSLIGLNTTNEPEWYSIYSIDGTTVTLNIQHNWTGSAGSLTTYKLQPLLYQQWQPLQSSAATPTGFTGPDGTTTLGYSNIEFGWDTTDMSTQPGYTCIDYQTLNAYPVGGNYQRWNKLIAVRGRNWMSNSNGNWNHGELHFVEFQYPHSITTINSTVNVDKCYCTCYMLFTSSAFLSVFTANTYNALYNNRTGGNGLANMIYIEAKTLNVKNMKLAGFRTPYITAPEGFIDTLKLYPSNATAISYHNINSGNGGICDLKIKNMNCYGSTATQAFNRNNSIATSKLSVENFTFENTPSAFITNNTSTITRDIVFVQNYNNTGLGKGAGGFYTLNSITTPVHTAGGVAWEFKITSTNTLYYNLSPDYYKSHNLRFAEIPVKANKLVTVKLWVRRAFITSKCALVVKPEVSGISDFVFAESSGAATTWEELTITFTPTVNSVVPLYFAGQYDATNANQSFYFDDLSVTIAD